MMCKTVRQAVDRRQGEAAWSPEGVDEEEEAGELGRREDQHNVSVASLAFNSLTHLDLTTAVEWRQSGHSTELSEGSQLESCQAT